MGNEFKLIVAGGREFNDYKLLCEKLFFMEQVFSQRDISIVSGMARGADLLGYRFAKEHGVLVHEYPADWNQFGKTAGYIRNSVMAKVADGLLAFWDGKSKGTKHMIDLMRKAEKFVHIVYY